MSTARKAMIGGAVLVLLAVVALVFGRPSSIADLDLVEARRLVAMMQEERGLTDVQCNADINRATMARAYWNSAPESVRPTIVKVISRVCLSDAGNARTLLRDETGATLEYQIEVR